MPFCKGFWSAAKDILMQMIASGTIVNAGMSLIKVFQSAFISKRFLVKIPHEIQLIFNWASKIFQFMFNNLFKAVPMTEIDQLYFLTVLMTWFYNLFIWLSVTGHFGIFTVMIVFPLFVSIGMIVGFEFYSAAPIISVTLLTYAIGLIINHYCFHLNTRTKKVVFGGPFAPLLLCFGNIHDLIEVTGKVSSIFYTNLFITFAITSTFLLPFLYNRPKIADILSIFFFLFFIILIFLGFGMRKKDDKGLIIIELFISLFQKIMDIILIPFLEVLVRQWDCIDVISKVFIITFTFGIPFINHMILSIDIENIRECVLNIIRLFSSIVFSVTMVLEMFLISGIAELIILILVLVNAFLVFQKKKIVETSSIIDIIEAIFLAVIQFVCFIDHQLPFSFGLAVGIIGLIVFLFLMSLFYFVIFEYEPGKNYLDFGQLTKLVPIYYSSMLSTFLLFSLGAFLYGYLIDTFTMGFKSLYTFRMVWKLEF